MKRYEFEWSSQPVEHKETAITEAAPLATKALGVVLKHFMVPRSGFDLDGWKKHDHYRHHLEELESETGDEVWIRPWLVGGWRDDQETIFEFEPLEFSEETLGPSRWSDLIHWRKHHHRGKLFGVYLTVDREKEGWQAVFGFRLDETPDAKRLEDVPVREALCLRLDGDPARVEAWLDWAYGAGRTV